MDVDKVLKQKVVSYLKQLSLSDEQALAYVFLLQHGPQTVLALSRGLKTGRTKLYPLLEGLAERQLITIHERHYGTSYEAQSPEVLEFLIAEKERKAEALRSNLPAMNDLLTKLRAASPTTSKIIEYRGIDGLKQMNWNLTKAEKEFRVLELAHLSDHLGKHFAEKVRQWQVDKKITSYDLTNDPDWHIDSNVINYKRFSHARYVDSQIFSIEFETFIYNNCTTLLNYDNNDIFGVEIYNTKLARQQKQLFDLLWSQARAIE